MKPCHEEVHKIKKGRCACADRMPSQLNLKGGFNYEGEMGVAR